MSLCATVCLTDVLLMGFGPQWSSEEYDIRLWLHTYTIAVSRITFFVGLGLVFFCFFFPLEGVCCQKETCSRFLSHNGEHISPSKWHHCFQNKSQCRLTKMSYLNLIQSVILIFPTDVRKTWHVVHFLQ